MGTTISERVEGSRRGGVGVHVVDDLRAPGRGCRNHRCPGRPGFARARSPPVLPRPEHEVVALDEVDPDPGVVLEAVAGPPPSGGEPHPLRTRGRRGARSPRGRSGSGRPGSPRHRRLEIRALELLERRAVAARNGHRPSVIQGDENERLLGRAHEDVVGDADLRSTRHARAADSWCGRTPRGGRRTAPARRT